MISLKLDKTFEDDTIFVSEFLRAEHKWALIFCDNWEYQLDAAQQTVEFFRITRSYKNVVLKENENAAIEVTTSRYLNAVILHDKTQNQEKIQNLSSESGHKNDKFKERKCVCNEIHLFKECFYIVNAARKSEWKESVKTLNEARQRILKNARFKTVIKVIIDINISNELNEDNETTQKEDTETAELDEMTFKFDNVTISATNIKNSLSHNVIYDFGCNQSLTYDKIRFIDGKITFASEWVDTSNDKMLVENYETMLINDKLENKTIKIKFSKTTYISFTNMTLLLLNKLKKKSYVWDMQEDVLIYQTSDQKVCNIEESLWANHNWV